MLKLHHSKESVYNPFDDEQYMSARMKQYFQDKLSHELQELIEEERQLSQSIPGGTNREPDFVDQSLVDELRFNHYVYQGHEQHLRFEVEAALQRLADGSYGYCAVTGKPIGLERLLAAPYAVYCFDVQEEKESYQPEFDLD